MKKILFVCSGNTCRSPLAEGLAKSILPDLASTTTLISSAGTSAMEGMPASTLSVIVADKAGIDISGHRARLLDAARVRESDLIVTMGAKHRETVGVINPDALAYTFLLTDFDDELEGDVLDPIGGNEETYQETYALIRRCVLALGRKLDEFDGWKE